MMITSCLGCSPIRTLILRMMIAILLMTLMHRGYVAHGGLSPKTARDSPSKLRKHAKPLGLKPLVSKQSEEPKHNCRKNPEEPQVCARPADLETAKARLLAKL